MKVAFLLYWKLNHDYGKIKCVLVFFKILYQTCISFSLFLSSSSIVVREATISSTLVPTFVSSMNNNTSCKVNLVFFGSTATKYDCQVVTNPPNFIPRPLSRPREQERGEPGNEVANPPSTLLSTSFKVPSFMREFLFCTIPAGKEHCYTNKISGVHKDRKEAFPLICQQVVFSASAVLHIICYTYEEKVFKNQGYHKSSVKPRS